MVKDINPGKDKSNPIYLTELNGQLYFSADDGADGYELWKSDGTEAGTVMVEDLFPGTYYDQDSQSFRGYSSYPGPFTKFNGELYFSTDVHVSLAFELHCDNSNDAETPVAVEFVTPSVTSQNLDDKMGWKPAHDFLANGALAHGITAPYAVV